MNRIGRIALALPLLLATVAASVAGDTSKFAKDEDAIWQLEQSIYAGRSGGNMSNYLNATDRDYAGWPPQAQAPMGYDALAAQAAKAGVLSGEELTMTKNLIRVHRDGNVALAYYTTHRTKRGGGAAVDERFETIHVWIREKDGSWKLLGGMARPVPANRASIGMPVPQAPAK